MLKRIKKKKLKRIKKAKWKYGEKVLENGTVMKFKYRKSSYGGILTIPIINE